MKSHTLACILIAAMIACPLSCGLGVCCAAEEVASLSAEGHCQCCCNQAADGEDCHDPANPPGQKTPSDSSQPCQGVCGGAVLDQSPIPTLNEQIAFLPRTLLDRVDSTTRFLSQHDPTWADPPSGRFLCVLHMSFLC